LGGRDPAQRLTQRSTASGVRPSVECFRRTDASAPPAESLPTPKIFLQKRLSHKGYPFMGQNHFWTGFCQRGHDYILKMESPPYRGASASEQPFGRTNGAGGSPLFIAPPSRGLMLAPSRYDGIVPAQTPSLMSLTTLKSRRWADGAAGRCSACRHRRSTSH